MINEQGLQLIITDKSLGSLTTNALQIKAAIEAALPDYDISNYTTDNIDLAKSDKAMLNKAKKALNDKRIEIEKEFMQPFEEFKSIVGDTVKLIGKCSDKIDSVVRQADEIERDAKRARIGEMWDATGFTLVPLKKVFVEKWLLKGTKEKEIAFDIVSKILSIENSLTTIDAIGEDVEMLKAMYLETLDLNATIQYSARLKENSRRLAEIAPEPAPARVQAPTVEPIPTITPVPSNPYSDVAYYRVVGFKSDFDTIAEFFDNNDIEWERIYKI